jgi:hypothetical protein
MEQGAEKILAKHGCLYMKDDYKALFEELEAYYKPTEVVKNNAVLPFVSGSTLHPVGKLPEGSEEDVCHLCRYKHECGSEEDVYERCLSELKQGEYYR